MGTPDGQLIHGLALRGEALPAGAPTDRETDFEVRLLPAAAIGREPPPGELVATLEGEGTHYAATREGRLLRVRFAEAADFEADVAAGEIAARAHPGREDLLPLLLAGSVLSLILGLRDEPVLHASAVELDGRAVAVPGPSGAGKSTVAALLCAAGGRIVTDDTARLELAADGVRVHRGSGELRLRGPAATLADDATRTPDGRVAMRAELTPEETAPIDALVFPRWDDSVAAPSAEALAEPEALELLLRSPRVAGWVAPGPLRVFFEAATALARDVPSFRVELPRDRYQDPGLAAATLDALRTAGAL